ncbi:site-2 protease family protein [Hydrogenothermus marinus]|uniref:Zinc metalloprotease n=1 Tax=Hydrogenothermus marinus TaxID=133270 RepID=A0A3M0BLI0_9AQUI|nr:site-2 protease family protein [Hydrogenothermus marinus]RMA97314.1 Zn-dependent protease [Hydrogenothermus marinus]
MKFYPIPLFRAFGIQINLDFSWFIVFFLISLTLAEGFYPQIYPGHNPIIYWIAGTISAVLLFICVLLHELGHSLVAMHFGISVKEINLFIFGGVAMIEGEAKSPKEEFLIAIAGPITSFILGLFFLILALLYPVDDILNGIINYLFYVNFIIAFFNLVPAFPLDGGRILRAFLWSKKDYLTATKITSNLGTYFAYFLVFFGFLYLIQGAFLSALWMGFLGFFLRQISKVSYEEAKISYYLSKYKVEQFITHVKPLLFSDKIEELISYYYPFYKVKYYPVIGNDGKFYYVYVPSLKGVSIEDSIEKYMEDIKCKVSPYDNLFQAYKLMNKCQVDELPVIYKNTLLGIIRKDSIDYIIQSIENKEQ